MTRTMAQIVSAPTKRHRRFCWFVLSLTLLITGFEIFYNLGHYALWDDEAMTALLGESVWRTGDTSIHSGHNIIAYEFGMLIHDGRDQYEPPLQFYLAAPFVGLLGNHAWAARLPFALCGLACVALMLYWLQHDDADPALYLPFCIGLVACTAMLLYFRQARYYAPAILLSVLVAYHYLHWQPRLWRTAALSIALALLFLDHYLIYGAMGLCLVVDYLLFHRHAKRYRRRDWPMLIIPQILVIGWIVLFRFPPGAGTVAGFQGQNTPWQKLLLFLSSFRGLNIDEFMPVILLPIAAIFIWLFRDRWLLRALIAMVVFLASMAIVAPSSYARLHGAEMRYLVPLIPLCLLIEVRVIRHIWSWRWQAGTLAAGIVFFTTLLNWPVASPSYRVPIRSTIAAYWQELLHSRIDSYSAAGDWIQQHVQPGQSIWVADDFNIYPLMFLDPDAIYAWQVRPDDPRFGGLDPINYWGKTPPDYILFFGPTNALSARAFQQLTLRQKYKLIDRLDIYYLDRPRPEISWHSFYPHSPFDQASDAIYVFEKAIRYKLTEPSTPRR